MKNLEINHYTNELAQNSKRYNLEVPYKAVEKGGAFIQNVKTDEQNTGIGNSKMKHINSQ